MVGLEGGECQLNQYMPAGIIRCVSQLGLKRGSY